MEFFIVFGALLFIMAIGIRKFLLWEPSENSCNPEKEQKDVKTNKVAWYTCFYGGLALIVIGIIGSLL